MSIVDALGREMRLSGAPRRVVSLVPSETETVVALAGMDRLVGRTDFCIEPPGIEVVPSVGGTKSIDVARVCELEPDLVLANQEENSRAQVTKLIEAGLAVHVSFPCSLAESAQYVANVARLLEVDNARPVVREAEEAAERAASRVSEHALGVFVPIWKEPWMTFDERTFASAMLAAAGARNVFGNRARQYPLAADLGQRDPIDDAGRDTRYPRIRLEEVIERDPSMILLPDEPYAFTEDDRRALAALDTTASRNGAVHLVDGKDLFWYGVRAAVAVERLIRLFEGELLRGE